MTSISDRARQTAGILLVAMVFVTPLSIAAIEILFPFLLAAWMLGWVLPGRTMERFRESPPLFRAVVLWLILYTAVCAFSIAYSYFWVVSLRGFVRKTLEYSLLFLIAADVITEPRVGERAMRALFCTGWLIIGHCLLQEWAISRVAHAYSTVRDPLLGRTLDYSRMVGPYKNPNDLTTYLMVAGLAVIAHLLPNGDPKPPFWRRPLGLLGLGLTGCLIWLHSRAGLLGFVSGLLPLLLLQRHRRGGVVGLTGLILLSLGGFLLLSWSSLQSILTLSDASAQERILMMGAGWKMFLATPFFGHGLNTFMSNYQSFAANPSAFPSYAHNCFLQIMAETGLVGLVAFLGFLFSLGRLCWRSLGSSPVFQPALAGLAAGLCAFLVQSFFDTNLYVIRQAVLFWTFSGMAAGLGACGLGGQPHRAPK